MAEKRALIVDDSRSARMALAGLLEKHKIVSDFAESGEEAVEFLKNRTVDVIFMDHTMPGMDGFETMKVIKADPRTAVIPVMMYTAKEGEVYVGQARALGAVEVLPKQVHPGVLFDMLLKLGLVVDRRAGRRRRSTDAKPTPARRADDVDEALERQALGMSVQALVTRVLQDQHLELRSDILAGNRDFAKRVAEEIFEKQRVEQAQAEQAPPPRAGLTGPGMALIALLVLIPLAVMFMLLAQAKEERDQLRQESARLAELVERQSGELELARVDMATDMDAERTETDSRYAAMLEALQWAVNEGNHFGYDEVALDDQRMARLQGLLARLVAIGFTGTVRVEAHLGDFCLQSDASGLYRLADPETLIMDCAVIGHPLGSSASPSERQTVGFANFLASSPLVNNSGIDVQVVAHGARDSVRRYTVPPSVRTAGEWNRIAELNNRVEFTLLP